MGDDSAALETLVAKYHAAIERTIQQTCSRWGVGVEDAKDLAVELWCCLLTQDGRVLRRFGGRSTLGTYLFRVFHRAAGAWILQQKVRQAVEIPGGDTYDAFGQDERRALLTETSPEAAIERRELIRALRVELMALPAADMTSILLWIDESSNAEIARLMDVSPNAVDLRRRRTLARLRRALGALAPMTKKSGKPVESGAPETGARPASAAVGTRMVRHERSDRCAVHWFRSPGCERVHRNRRLRKKGRRISPGRGH
ncbi:MAG: sigma-70 family RNA polymerase sigma factor [Vicinamibacterales bacterium]